MRLLHTKSRRILSSSPALMALLVLALESSAATLPPFFSPLGNSAPDPTWLEASAAVLEVEYLTGPPFVTFDILDEQRNSGAEATAEIEVFDLGRGILMSASRASQYDLGVRIDLDGAGKEIRANALIRDEFYVETPSGVGSILEFDFRITIEEASAAGDPALQFSLIGMDPEGNAQLLDDVREIDFGLDDGAFEESFDVTLSTLGGVGGENDPEFLVASGTYVPLQFALTAIGSGNTYLDAYGSAQLTGVRAVDIHGTPLDATYLSALYPDDPMLNQVSAVPEPSSLIHLGIGLIGLLGCGWWRRRKRISQVCS